jgi:hypothetical protein
VKNIALAALIALSLFPCAQAGAEQQKTASGMAEFRLGGALAPPGGRVVLQSRTSELAEPEVFAMMLLGLCLIGYRVRRDSSEKFE